MTITKTCNTCEHYPNDKHCIGCEWDKGKGENSKWELKKNPIVIERAVLDKIRVEIDEISLSEPMVSADGLICYGSKSITVGHFRKKVIAIIDKYMGVSE